ncbi:MAG TPA: TolC family protein [Methylococcaceae bacterium]|nr:TolC family protein [Methylococcaceae bacterium]
MKAKIARWLFPFWLAAAAWGGHPREGETVLALPELVEEALRNNPEIQAAERQAEAAGAVISQVRTLPDPLFNVGYRNVDERETMYGVTQEIPFPGKLGLKGEVAARDAERMEQEYRAARLDVVARLKEAYYDLHFVHDSSDVVEKNKRLLQDFAKTAEVRYAVGEGAQQDVFRAQAEVSRLLARLATLEQKRRSLHAELNRLLNRTPSDPLGTPGEIALTPVRRDADKLLALSEEAAPLLKAQQKNIERGEQAAALARREYLPDFEVSAQGVRNSTMKQDGYQVMLGVKVPLYFASKQKEGVREAVALQQAAAQGWQATRQELAAKIRDNLAQAERSAELVALLKDAIIPQARLTLASAQAGYAVGQVDFLTLLNSLLTLQENEIELHGEMVEHEKALARLEAIVGEQP